MLFLNLIDAPTRVQPRAGAYRAAVKSRAHHGQERGCCRPGSCGPRDSFALDLPKNTMAVIMKRIAGQHNLAAVGLMCISNRTARRALELSVVLP